MPLVQIKGPGGYLTLDRKQKSFDTGVWVSGRNDRG